MQLTRATPVFTILRGTSKEQTTLHPSLLPQQTGSLFRATRQGNTRLSVANMRLPPSTSPSSPLCFPSEFLSPSSQHHRHQTAPSLQFFVTIFHTLRFHVNTVSGLTPFSLLPMPRLIPARPRLVLASPSPRPRLLLLVQSTSSATRPPSSSLLPSLCHSVDKLVNEHPALTPPRPTKQQARPLRSRRALRLAVVQFLDDRGRVLPAMRRDKVAVAATIHRPRGSAPAPRPTPLSLSKGGRLTRPRTSAVSASGRRRILLRIREGGCKVGAGCVVSIAVSGLGAGGFVQALGVRIIFLGSMLLYVWVVYILPVVQMASTALVVEVAIGVIIVCLKS